MKTQSCVGRLLATRQPVGGTTERESMSMRAKNLGLAAVAATAALVLAACGGGSSSSESSSASSSGSESSSSSASESSSSEAPAEGGTVTIWASLDQPVIDGLKAGLEPLAAEKGITVDWQKVDDINSLIITTVQAGEVPDIALIPQPGVVRQLVDLGAAYPLDGVVDMATLQSTMIPGELEAGTFDGQLYGLLTSMNVKGLVWYPKAAWEAGGYAVPTIYQ